MTGATNNLVVVSDLHCGCKIGLYPPEGVTLDGGGSYTPSEFQRKVWAWWTELWDEWVPWATQGERYDVLVNGDALDGVHHHATTQITHNLADQHKIAVAVLEPILTKPKAKRYFHVRGTEAHSGPSGAQEETLAGKLGAVEDEEHQAARNELWVRVGGALVHALHHIGTTSSNAYEGTAVHKELVESYTEASRWSEEPPDYIVRSHRHRYFATKIISARGRGEAVVTPGWQGKTPFAWRIAGARLTPPQFGAVVIRQGKDMHYTLERVWHIGRPAVA